MNNRRGMTKKTVGLVLVMIFSGSPLVRADSGRIQCEGIYPRHLQGVCIGDNTIYWSFTTVLVKTGMDGKLLEKVPVVNHHGDLCFRDDNLYVAVNLGAFNDPRGNADSWVYVYDGRDLSLVGKHETQEVFHGAGGIGVRDGHFFLVGGLPNGVEVNYVYEYDGDFRFIERHVIRSGHTLMGIQTAAFGHDRWCFGCYGDPKILLVTDAEFRMQERYEFDGSLGIVALPKSGFLVASGHCERGKGCTGIVRPAVLDDQSGPRYIDRLESREKNGGN